VQQVEAAAEAMRAMAESEGLRAMAGELQRERQGQQVLATRLAQQEERAQGLQDKLAAGQTRRQLATPGRRPGCSLLAEGPRV
jgi:hypothetical protein